MASGSSGRPIPGSKGFDFASDDILCSYDDFSNQDAANGTHSDPSIGTHSTMLNNNRLLFKTMSINRYLGFIVFLLLLNLGSSSFISETVFESYRSTGRSLLQSQKNCPINFENQNYTIITSQCKGPRYAADTCCKAFKEFACPFSEELNDMSNNCASTMFSYINLYGKYPPGIFANECKEGKNGLECDEKSANAVSKDSKSSSAHSISVLSPVAVVLIFASSLVSFFCLF